MVTRSKTAAKTSKSKRQEQARLGGGRPGQGSQVSRGGTAAPAPGA